MKTTTPNISPKPWLRRAASGALLCALLTACDPIDVIRWAPDGQHALVQTENGDSKIIDATGQILATAHGMRRVWLSDSRRAAGVRKVAARDWAEYAAVLGPDRAADVVHDAEEFLPYIQHYTGDWSKFDEDPAVKHWSETHHSMEAAVYYLAQQRPAEIAEAVAQWRKETKDDSPLTEAIYELTLEDALQFDPPQVRTLLRSADPISFLVPSPNSKVLAFVRDRPESASLEIIPSDGGQPQFVAAGAEQADWTPDGQQLVFTKPGTVAAKGQQMDLSLGTVTQQRVCAADGSILPELGAAEDLAGTVFLSGRSRVACLPDGRILFAALVMQLPALNKDLPKEVTLFALRPGDAPALERVISAAAQKKLPDRVDQFVLSPDARRVAIPGENGEVAVFSLENGEVTTLQKDGWDFASQGKFFNSTRVSSVQPSWRGADEVCYVASMPDRDGKPQRAEMVLRKLGGEPRPISQGWSDAETDAFLARLKPVEADRPEVKSEKEKVESDRGKK
jgi:hypothetical protein